MLNLNEHDIYPVHKSTFISMIDSTFILRRKNVIQYFTFCEHSVVNSEIFAIIVFSRIALEHIFATLKSRDKGVIYLYQ